MSTSKETKNYFLFVCVFLRTIEDGGKRSIFMCNTVELARQHFVELKKCLNLNIGLYVGDRDVDLYHRGKWEHELRNNQAS